MQPNASVMSMQLIYDDINKSYIKKGSSNENESEDVRESHV